MCLISTGLGVIIQDGEFLPLNTHILNVVPISLIINIHTLNPGPALPTKCHMVTLQGVHTAPTMSLMRPPIITIPTVIPQELIKDNPRQTLIPPPLVWVQMFQYREWSGIQPWAEDMLRNPGWKMVLLKRVEDNTGESEPSRGDSPSGYAAAGLFSYIIHCFAFFLTHPTRITPKSDIGGGGLSSHFLLYDILENHPFVDSIFENIRLSCSEHRG